MRSSGAPTPCPRCHAEMTVTMRQRLEYSHAGGRSLPRCRQTRVQELGWHRPVSRNSVFPTKPMATPARSIRVGRRCHGKSCCRHGWPCLTVSAQKPPAPEPEVRPTIDNVDVEAAAKQKVWGSVQQTLTPLWGQRIRKCAVPRSASGQRSNLHRRQGPHGNHTVCPCLHHLAACLAGAASRAGHSRALGRMACPLGGGILCRGMCTQRARSWKHIRVNQETH